MRTWVAMAALMLFYTSGLNAEDYDYLLKEAASLTASGRLVEAAELYSRLISARPGAPYEPRARLRLGYLLIKMKAPPEKAMEEFQRVAYDFPDCPEAPTALLRTGYLKEAQRQVPTEWEEIVKKYPATREAAEALHLLGHLALRARDALLAAERFEASAAAKGATRKQIEDSLAEAGYAYISQYWKTANKEWLERAAEHFTKLKAESSDDLIKVRAGLGLGEIYVIRREGAKAAQEYGAVLALKPKSPFLAGLARFGLASALYTSKDYQGAVAAYDEFLAEQSGVTLLEKAASWKIKKPGYADLLATNPERAERLMAVQLVAEAAYWKAWALFRAGRVQEGCALADEVLRTFADTRCAKRAAHLRMLCDLRKEER